MGPVSTLTWVLCMITAVCPSLLENRFLILFTCVCECCTDKMPATGDWCEWIWGLWLQPDQGCRCPAASGGSGPSYWSFGGLTGDLVPKPLGQEVCAPQTSWCVVPAAGKASVCISPSWCAWHLPANLQLDQQGSEGLLGTWEGWEPEQGCWIGRDGT